MHNWTDIKREIKKAGKILIFTHMSMDGDAAGSSCALCKSLRRMGKEAYILLEDECPEYLLFSDGEGCFVKEAPWTADAAIAVDCSGDSRIEKRVDAFRAAGVRLCVDHHIKTGPFADYEVIDPDSPAAGNLVFELLKDMGAPIDKSIAENLYTAIVTDTGRFRFSNTTPQALLDVAELMGYGIDYSGICNKIWDSTPLPQLKLEALAVDRAEIFAGGKAAISWCNQEDIKALGAKTEMTETCIDRLRAIQGVEIAAFLKEKEDGRLKCSLRSKEYANVNAIAAKFDGGGHERASGCSFKCSAEEALMQLKAAIEEQLS